MFCTLHVVLVLVLVVVLVVVVVVVVVGCTALSRTYRCRLAGGLVSFDCKCT